MAEDALTNGPIRSSSVLMLQISFIVCPWLVKIETVLLEH